MGTPISSATAYASASDLLNVKSAHKIGQWATDAGVELTPGAILTNTVVAAALLRASGEVEMYCYRGGKYTPTMLGDLTGASEASLKGLVCDLASYFLACRVLPEESARAACGYERTEKVLAALEKGDLVFGLQEIADAGNMSPVDTSENSTGYVNRPSDVARRRFGKRMDDTTGYPITGQR